MDFNREINFSSTPVRRIRFRGDAFQSDNEPLLENDNNDDYNNSKSSEPTRERGLFTFLFLSRNLKRPRNHNFFSFPF